MATYRLAKALKASGEWEVYDAFRSMWDGKSKSVYSEIIQLGHSNSGFVKDLADFIRRHEIDVVVNMTRFFRHRHIVKAARRSGRDVKIIFMQHFAPGSEMKKPTYRSGLHLLKLNPYNPLYWLRSTVYPLIKMRRNLRWPKVYKSTYESSHKIILLSAGYVNDYKRIAGIKETDKFLAIPNIFELETSQSKAPEFKNEKRVLVMSRMDEIQKRISLALKVWKKIEENKDLNDWHLDIVGTGHDMALEKRLAKKLQLKNITFHGWGDRDKFLSRSPILMMTSEYEGLPLTILEAQAYGCVPIAFNSYASLGDVVKDGENGVLVEEFGDIDTFAEKLASLMRDETSRSQMARKSLMMTSHFSSKNIGDKWLEMLQNL